MKKYLLSIMLMSILLFYGCSEYNEKNNVTQSEYAPIIIGPTNQLTYDQIYNNYAQSIDTTKVIGFLSLSNDFVSGKTYDGTFFTHNLNIGKLAITGYNDSLYAVIGASSINFNPLLPDFQGEYVYYSRGDENNQTGMLLNYGSINNIQIGNSSVSGLIDTTFDFFQPMDILNLQQGQQVSQNADLTVMWNGGLTDYVHFSITQVTTQDSLGSFIYNGSCFLENDGVYTFPVTQIQQFPVGLYDISLTNFYPYFLYDDFGNIIVAIVESKRTITINLSI